MKNKIKKPITKANSSLANLTGSWRTHKPITDYKKCIGCENCVKVCPEGCIEMKIINKNNRPKTNYKYCKGCGLCANECPVKAITMKKDY